MEEQEDGEYGISRDEIFAHAQGLANAMEKKGDTE
jgi:hypothetical protein